MDNPTADRIAQLEAERDALKREAACPCCRAGVNLQGEVCQECHGKGLAIIAYEYLRVHLKLERERLEAENAHLLAVLEGANATARRRGEQRDAALGALGVARGLLEKIPCTCYLKFICPRGHGELVYERMPDRVVDGVVTVWFESWRCDSCVDEDSYDLCYHWYICELKEQEERFHKCHRCSALAATAPAVAEYEKRMKAEGAAEVLEAFAERDDWEWMFVSSASTSARQRIDEMRKLFTAEAERIRAEARAAALEARR